MRVRIGLVAAAVAFGATPCAAAADPARNAFDRSIADTKQKMMGDPRTALTSADRSLALAAQLPDGPDRRIATATAQWLKAEALIGINAPERATPVVAQAIATVAAAAPGTKLHGDLLRTRGALAAMSGRASEALRSFQSAYRIFQRAGERRSSAIALQDIGQIYRDAGDFERVLRYYDQSQEVFSEDPFLRLTTYNNRAQVLRELHRYPAAIAEYENALKVARTLKSPLLEARILTNLAAAQIDGGRLGQADRTIAAATRLARSGEAAGWRTFVFGVAAKAAAAHGDDERAAQLVERMFDGADLSTTPMPFREFHQLAAGVYERLGRNAVALDHLKAFQRLDAEARALVASTNSQLMAAQFDYTNQKVKISKLTEGQLKRDVALARQRTLIFQVLLAAGALALAALGFWLWQSRKSRLRLASSNRALEKALAAKTEFLATTSHEIRTPLNGILGMTQVILADPRVAPDTRERVEVVQGAGEAMKALVDDLLDVAKMEAGELDVVEEETDLAAIVEEARKLWGAQAQLKGLTLTVDRSDAPNRILSDATRLRQILFNLMSNATKFTLAGGVTLTVRTEGEQLVIAVADTGIGIAADHHDRIFEPFLQVDGGKDRRFSGTGLGLSICRRLAAAMGGSISVASELEQGATFTVRLPLRRVAVEAVVSATTLADAAVLIADRNALTISILRSVLSPACGRVTTAANADAVTASLATDTLDHVLVDANIAGDGDPVTVLRDIVAAARRAGVRSTLLYSDAALSVAALAAIGADRAIAKPVGAADMIAAMAAMYLPVADAVIALPAKAA